MSFLTAHKAPERAIRPASVITKKTQRIDSEQKTKTNSETLTKKGKSL